ncbi:hypothetical protein TcCL_NonESM06062, partial [Trypanosoma cruzi]
MLHPSSSFSFFGVNGCLPRPLTLIATVTPLLERSALKIGSLVLHAVVRHVTILIDHILTVVRRQIRRQRRARLFATIDTNDVAVQTRSMKVLL